MLFVGENKVHSQLKILGFLSKRSRVTLLRPMEGRVGNREEPLLDYRYFAYQEYKFLKSGPLFSSAMNEREW